MIPINKIVMDADEIRAAVQVLRSGMLTSKSGSGPNVMRFEAAFSDYVGTKYAVAVNSGTSALHAALVAAGVGAGDEVIVPSFTFVATAEAVALSGAKPVFVDIDPEMYCIDPSEVERAITSRTKAVIPVHLYGLTAYMDRIMEIARDNNLVVIEDAAQAHGAKCDGKLSGNLGDMGCFSFYGGKNMTTGEGGMVTTNSAEFYNALKAIRNHGETSEYQSAMIGHNYRMPEIEAAIGFVQLSKLPKFLESRRRNAKAFSEILDNTAGVNLPSMPSGCEHSWYVYTLRLQGGSASKRDKILGMIRRKHVDARVYYPRPIHMFHYYRKNFGAYKLPKTEAAARRVFSIPSHPGLTESDVERVASAVKTSLE